MAKSNKEEDICKGTLRSSIAKRSSNEHHGIFTVGKSLWQKREQD